jgi:membrane associated rhomboid family serine protease
MFIPLHDDAPLRVIRFQMMTFGLIALNVAVFLVTGAFPGEAFLASVAQGFGVVPAEFVSEAARAHGVNPVPEPVTLLTYMFLHGGWMHLISNLLFLWIFADNVEDAFGHVGFVLFYLLCGMAAGLAHVLLNPTSPVPLVGASGAISGVLAAYFVLYPRARVWVLAFFPLPIRISAVWVLGIWFVIQVLSLFATDPESQAIGWWAHIGGFLTGLVLTWLLKNRLLIRVGE